MRTRALLSRPAAHLVVVGVLVGLAGLACTPAPAAPTAAPPGAAPTLVTTAATAPVAAPATSPPATSAVLPTMAPTVVATPRPAATTAPQGTVAPAPTLAAPGPAASAVAQPTRTAAAPSGPATRVQVVMNEWSLKPSVAAAPAGEVTFEVTNQGKLPHELIVVKTDLAADALTLEADGARVEETAPGQDDVGEVEDIQPGETKSGTFNLEAGHYVLVCNVPGHYKAGMVASFQVK